MLQPVNIEKTAGYLVYRVGRLMRYRATRYFKENGIPVSPEQWELLLKVGYLDSPVIGDLIDGTVNDHPNITRLVSGLEGLGLVSRSPNPEDKRSFLVSLTSEGAALIDRIYPMVAEEKERYFDGLDRRDVQALIETLQRMEKNLE